MNYLFDENVSIPTESKPDNVINAKDIMLGANDKKLIKKAKQMNLMIVTGDEGLVLRAVRSEMNIVYASGLKRQHWFFIPYSSKITSRIKLKRYIYSGRAISV